MMDDPRAKGAVSSEGCAPAATSPAATVEIDGYRFPPFDLARLLRTVFELEGGERFGVFTDLPQPREVAAARFLSAVRPGGPQYHAWHTIYEPLRKSSALAPGSVDFFAYAEVGGSNLELPPAVFDLEGRERPLREVLAELDIALYVGTWSATAPLTALARQLGFRGATMHGINDRVVASGLAVDYREVSARAERLRRHLSRADAMVMEWQVDGERPRLEVLLGGQEAQKSHGLVRERGEVANLPAGEVYYVPVGAEGRMPIQFEDPERTIAIFSVAGGSIRTLERLVHGSRRLVEDWLGVIASDPAAGMITELGLGTQSLPWAGTDIQDEKIIGTAHLATGRSDHLGGAIGPQSFRDLRNASHNDILYTPVKTPRVRLERVRMRRGGEESLVLERYEPAAALRALL
ncbi:MAG: hypothetical protein KatS3mg102_2924 [Planctomycetota bacterium]|nr:MAG: hypothetical protein KatS3mg102_2924 [Planctomycetota bacterium]